MNAAPLSLSPFLFSLLCRCAQFSRLLFAPPRDRLNFRFFSAATFFLPSVVLFPMMSAALVFHFEHFSRLLHLSRMDNFAIIFSSAFICCNHSETLRSCQFCRISFFSRVFSIEAHLGFEIQSRVDSYHFVIFGNYWEKTKKK